MSEVQKIMNIMNTINYGYLDELGNDICDDSYEDYIFSDIYRLMSPEELLNKKYGVCWDQVELERKLFEESNIKTETYFIYIDDNNMLPSHTFLVYYDKGKVYWFEHSWFDQKGIHEYNSIDDLIKDVKIKFINYNKINQDYKVYMYKYNKPSYNISCNEFYDYIYKQEKIAI